MHAKDFVAFGIGHGTIHIRGHRAHRAGQKRSVLELGARVPGVEGSEVVTFCHGLVEPQQLCHQSLFFLGAPGAEPEA